MATLTAWDKYLNEYITKEYGGSVLNFRKSTSSYRELVLGKDPLIFHTFDLDMFDGQGTTKLYYDSARGYRTYNNTIRRIYGAFGTDPSIGSNGLVFNGSSAIRQNLNLPAGPGYGTTASSYINVLKQEAGFTLECWINKAATGGYSEVMWVGGDYNQDRGAKIRVDGNGTWVAFRMQSIVPTVHEVFVGSLTLANSAWHHLAATWDGTDMKMYVDGVLKGTTTPPASTVVYWPTGTSTSEVDNTAAILQLGSWLYGGTALTFDGVIDAAAVYAHALSVGSILGNYTTGLTASNRNTYVPAEGFSYAIGGFPPFVIDDGYIAGRAVVTSTAATGGYSAWKDADDNSIAGALDTMSVTVRYIDDIGGSRRIENVVSIFDGFSDYFVQFGLGYDPAFTSTDGKFLKFAVYNGDNIDVSQFPTYGGDLTPTADDGYYEFEWEPRRFYNFELVNTGTGVALYVDDVLVDAFTCDVTGFNTTPSFLTQDWQRYDDPLVEHDWLVIRGTSSGTEYSLKAVDGNLNNFDWYETQTRDAVRVSGYILRHRSHVPEGSQSLSSGLYTYSLDDALFAVRPTLANSPGVNWLPIRNTLDEV